MANIHQTMKRVAALYEDLIGTREEIARCVEELQRWQKEEREWRRRSQEETRALVQEAREDVVRLRREAKAAREEIDSAARGAGERWLTFLFFVGICGAMLAALLLRAWIWLFPRW